MRPTKLLKTLPLCALLGLPGCAIFSSQPHYRGVAITNNQLQQLTPGVSRETDVRDLIGPPTFIEPYAPNHWVYVEQITHMRIGQTEGIKKQEVVVLTFNQSGTYQSYKAGTLKDALPVAMDGKTTPVAGGTHGFFERLVNGVGSYNPLGTANDTSGTGASALGGSGSSGDSGF